MGVKFVAIVLVLFIGINISNGNPVPQKAVEVEEESAFKLPSQDEVVNHFQNFGEYMKNSEVGKRSADAYSQGSSWFSSNFEGVKSIFT